VVGGAKRLRIELEVLDQRRGLYPFVLREPRLQSRRIDGSDVAADRVAVTRSEGDIYHSRKAGGDQEPVFGNERLIRLDARSGIEPEHSPTARPGPPVARIAYGAQKVAVKSTAKSSTVPMPISTLFTTSSRSLATDSRTLGVGGGPHCDRLARSYLYGFVGGETPAERPRRRSG
jgi:hypothetical protein